MSDDLVERLRGCPHYPYHNPSHAFFNGDLCMGSECVREREAADRIEELEAALVAVADVLLPALENGLNDELMRGYSMLRDIVEALGDNHECRAIATIRQADQLSDRIKELEAALRDVGLCDCLSPTHCPGNDMPCLSCIARRALGDNHEMDM